MQLSPALFDLTLLACERTAFCHHLVLECALKQPDEGDAGWDEHQATCDDMTCCLALPSLAADIQSIYLENLHRQPDAYGIEYYCNKVLSGRMSVSEIRFRMARSSEGRQRKAAALVDDYLDLRFGGMASLVDSMCRTLNSRMCTPAFQRQLLVMLYKGQVNIAYVAKVLQPNSPVWQSSALTFDMMFKASLCREGEEEEREDHLRILQDILSLQNTWTQLRKNWACSAEARWCLYRRRIESHSLLLSGGRLEGGAKEARSALASEGCSMPLILPVKPLETLAHGVARYGKTPIQALYPRLACAPLFDLVHAATEGMPHQLGRGGGLEYVLLSHDGQSFGVARSKVQDAYCQALGHQPPVHELNEHLSHIVSWRRSLQHTHALVHGSVEMQVRKQWLDLLAHVPELAAHLAPTTRGGNAADIHRVAVQALAGAVLGGQMSLEEVAALKGMPSWISKGMPWWSGMPSCMSSQSAHSISEPPCEGMERALSASAFVERGYMQLTGQFSLSEDAILRQHLVSHLLSHHMTRPEVMRALARTCLVAEACLDCAPYANLSHPPYANLSPPYQNLSQWAAVGQSRASSAPSRGTAHDGTADGLADEIAHGMPSANPCCCTGGKERRDALNSMASATAEQRARLDAWNNKRLQEELLESMHSAFGASETGALHMSALVNNQHLHHKDAPVIVVYVHNRPLYFGQVVQHLRQVDGIETALLIVSFDGLFSDMLEVAKTIDFCQFRLLVHTARQTLPYMQSLVAIKEHWAWLVQQVFMSVPETMERNGFVLFLEEDHILSSDALTVLSALTSYVTTGGCSNCWGVGLRFGCSEPNASDATGVCEADGFVNTGYAFNRSVFDKIHHNQDLFWSFSEGWDYSLFHLIQVTLMTHDSSRCLASSDARDPHHSALALFHLMHVTLITLPLPCFISKLQVDTHTHPHDVHMMCTV